MKQYLSVKHILFIVVLLTVTIKSSASNICPNVYNVGGGLTFCGNGPGPGTTITLSGSQTGVSYQLILDSSNFGSAKSGTGSSLSWTTSSQGSYTIVATGGGCSQTMSGGADYLINPNPSSYLLSGPGAVCPSGQIGGPSPIISLSGSEIFVNYQLKKDGVNVGSTSSGNGSAKSWNVQPVAGTYTVVATNITTGCSSSMSGSPVVTLRPYSNQYTLSGGAVLCSPNTGSVTLSQSQVGFNYELMLNINTVTSLAGTGSSLTFTNITASGTYTARVNGSQSGGCTVSMLGSATFTFNPAPFDYSVSGGGMLCTGDIVGRTIAVGGSQTGVNYQLKLNGLNLGTALAGTGGSLQWTNQLGAGTYTVVATNSTTGCSKLFATSTTIGYNPLPTQFNVGGSQQICGSGNFSISLDGSQLNQMSYQLKLNGNNFGATKSGTGSPLVWAGLSSAGTYTISATSSSSCTVNMLGNAVVSYVSLPTAFALSGGGTRCSDAAGLPISINGSQTGINYQLKLNGVNQGSALAGTGSSLQWIATAEGSYTITATNPITGCFLNFSGAANIVVNAVPVAYNVTGGGGTFCQGSSPGILTLSQSEADVAYILKLNGTGVDSKWGLSGGGSLTFNTLTNTGTYTVVGQKQYSGCQNAMLGNAIVVVNPLPNALYISAPYSTGCTADPLFKVSMVGSQVGINYQLLVNGANVGGSISGTGNNLIWPSLGSSGVYTVLATNATTGCSSTMLSALPLNVYVSPTVFDLTGGNITCGGSTTLGLSGSQNSISYRLTLNGGDLSLWQNGNGNPLSWATQSTPGTYTIKAIDTNTSCSVVMNGSSIINPLPTQYTVTGGGVYCTGIPPSVNLTGSQPGINYQLQINGINSGPPLTAIGQSVNWNRQTMEGTYSVVAIDPVTNCSLTMSGNPTISINPECHVVNNFTFQYRYDDRHRMIQKRVPGADWEYMVYDDRDRLVMTQDGEQRKSNQWTFTKYDQLNRPIITGIYTHASTLDQQQMSAQISSSNFYETYNNNASTHGYSNNLFPNTATDVLTVNYYDNYDFVTALINDAAYEYSISEGLPGQYNYNGAGKSFPRVLNKATGSKVKVLEQTTSTYLWNVAYYDNRYQIVQTVNTNHRNGIDRTSSIYDFSGRVTDSKNSYLVNGITHYTTHRHEFDHSGRLLKTWHGVDGPASVLLVKNEYNELGQLVDKKLHNTDPVSTNDYQRQFKQSTDYRYNIRGWLTSVNNSELSNDGITNDDSHDLFGMNLEYNGILGTGNVAQYNGNISGIKWSANQGLDVIKERAYNYSYDVMNRLHTADFLSGGGMIWANPLNSFSETGYDYDLNGNLLKMKRYGANGATMDDMTYNYGLNNFKGNRLLMVSDNWSKSQGFLDGTNADNDFDYDNNGNMTLDKNKDIKSISYNHLNLPEKIIKKDPNSSNDGDFISYVYDATGRKLSQLVFNSTSPLTPVKRTDYIGELFFEDGSLKFINHKEGRVIINGADKEYQYHLKDHLGNIRTTFTTKDEIDDGKATYETANTALEQSKFLNYDKVRFINNSIYDHTYDHQTEPVAGVFAQRLSGVDKEKIGLARSLSVMPGDKIKIEVYAKYYQPVAGDNSVFAQLMYQISTGMGIPANTIIDAMGYASGASLTLPFVSGLNKSTADPTVPKAFLNWIVFNRDNVQDLSRSGFKQISTLGRESGGNLDHELLAPDNDIDIVEPGYIYVWVSNENMTMGGNAVEVYFDDFKVTQIKSPVVQIDDYFPFGLTFNSYQRENAVKQDFLYNGKEIQDELGLNWLDYGARMYMPEIGRWGAIDPHANSYEITSPYNYGFNNPLLFVDPTGMDNVLYLIAAGKMDRKVMQSIIDKANTILKTLGLETRVVLHEGKNFDVGNLDNTDNWAVIGNDRKAIAAKVKDITDDGIANHVDRWADLNIPGNPENPEIADRHNRGKGIAIDHETGNVGTHKTNSSPDPEGGSALELVHAASHSDDVIQGADLKPGSGNIDGHMPSGIMMDGNGLVHDYRSGGIPGIVKQDNAAYIKAMKTRYGSRIASDNYRSNQQRNENSSRMNAQGSGVTYGIMEQ